MAWLDHTVADEFGGGPNPGRGRSGGVVARNIQGFRNFGGIGGRGCLTHEVRNLVDHGVGGLERDAARIFDGDVQGAQDQVSALEIDGIAHEGVDNFHKRHLDGLFVLYDGEGVEAGLRWGAHAAMDALVEVAELLSSESGGSTTDSGDLDMSAGRVGHIGFHLVKNFG